MGKSFDRELRRLHQQMRAWDAAGGVQPEPVVNRRTGETITFGPRRCFDGAWVIEMLGASGCTKAEVEAAIFVLEPLFEHDVKINKDLLKLLVWYHEPLSPEDRARARRWDQARARRSEIHIVGDNPDDPPPAA